MFRYILFIITLASCSSKPLVVDRSFKQVNDKLEEVALKVESSLNALAHNEIGTNPPIIEINKLITPEGGMGDKTNIDWSGPLVPLLIKISDLSSYKLKVIGREPPIPILVTVFGKDKMLADILKDAQYQAQYHARIVPYPSSKVLELRYLPFGGQK